MQTANILITKNPPICLISTTIVNLHIVAANTLYVVPAGKKFLPYMAMIRVGSNALETEVTFGQVGSLTDWLDTRWLYSLDEVGAFGKLMPGIQSTPYKSIVYGAGTVFQMDVTVAEGGATNYVDLFGYLVNA